MSDPAHTIRNSCPVPGLVTLVPMLTAAAWIVTASGAECPIQAAETSAAELLSKPLTSTTLTESDPPLYVQSEGGAEATRDGPMLLKGEVTVTQGDRKLSTRDATYDPKSQSIEVKNGVEYADPSLKVSGQEAHF